LKFYNKVEEASTTKITFKKLERKVTYFGESVGADVWFHAAGGWN
jgi:hypothetical protein